MSPSMKCRGLAATGAAVGGALVFVTPPILDLFVMMAAQLTIATGVALVMHKRVGLRRLLPLVVGWTLAGAVIGFGIELGIPILGKLFVAPVFALFWTYMLGEVSIWRAALQK